MDPVRAFGNPYSFEPMHGWASRTLVSTGMAGFLALMGVLSFPLPWTPVPFSMMPVGLLVAGAVQRPGYAALSVLLYLGAGALGAGIYADGESGWRHLVGATAGYLWGFVLVSGVVGWYMQRPRRFMPPWATRLVLGLLGLGMGAGVAAIAWMLSTGTSIGSLTELGGWGVGSSAVWVFAFLVTASTAITVWALRRRKAQARAAVELYIVMLAAILMLHVCGVTVLWLATDLSLMSAIVLGSVVFLPFDAIKAGLAVAATLPFFPNPEVSDA